MSNTYSGGFITVAAVGTTLTSAATSANTAIPNASDGNRPRYLRVAATSESYIKLGIAGVAATANDLMVQPADCVLLAVPNGVTHIAVIQGATAAKVNIVPLENI